MVWLRTGPDFDQLLHAGALQACFSEVFQVLCSSTYHLTVTGLTLEAAKVPIQSQPGDVTL